MDELYTSLGLTINGINEVILVTRWERATPGGDRRRKKLQKAMKKCFGNGKTATCYISHGDQERLVYAILYISLDAAGQFERSMK